MSNETINYVTFFLLKKWFLYGTESLELSTFIKANLFVAFFVQIGQNASSRHSENTVISELESKKDFAKQKLP